MSAAALSDCSSHFSCTGAPVSPLEILVIPLSNQNTAKQNNLKSRYLAQRLKCSHPISECLHLISGLVAPQCSFPLLQTSGCSNDNSSNWFSCLLNGRPELHSHFLALALPIADIWSMNQLMTVLSIFVSLPLKQINNFKNKLISYNLMCNLISCKQLCESFPKYTVGVILTVTEGSTNQR